MTIRIWNDSITAVVRGYAVDSYHTVIWLEMAPQHPKTISAIWVDSSRPSAPGYSSATSMSPEAGCPTRLRE